MQFGGVSDVLLAWSMVAADAEAGVRSSTGFATSSLCARRCSYGIVRTRFIRRAAFHYGSLNRASAAIGLGMLSHNAIQFVQELRRVRVIQFSFQSFQCQTNHVPMVETRANSLILSETQP